MVAQQRKSVGNAEHPPTLLGGTAIKPPERKGFDIIRYFLHDPEKGEYFTRTPKSWALIFIFYCIYYSCLAAFWYGMLQIFFQFMPLDRPKYTLDESIIGTNPGVGMAPNQPDVTIDSSMLFLQWNAKDEKPSSDFETATNIDWAKRYERVIERYDNKTQTRVCSGSDYNQEGKDACVFDAKAVLGDCAKFPYGYQVEGSGTQVEPCVLLRINRIYGWQPEPYGEDELEGVPENVQKLIKNDPNNIYIDCAGENPADRDVLEGQLTYYPSNQAIPYYYFPYTQTKQNYHKPLVAVKFGSGIPIGQLLHIECKLWTKGIRHSSKHREGQVHFELILDNYPKKEE